LRGLSPCQRRGRRDSIIRVRFFADLLLSTVRGNPSLLTLSSQQGWLDLMQYYIKGYKTGAYPAITRDRVFLWARKYPANASAPDHVGKPDHWDYVSMTSSSSIFVLGSNVCLQTQDYLWAVALLPSPATVTLSCGSSTTTSTLPKGLAKMRLKLSTDCDVKVKIQRNGGSGLDFTPQGFRFTKSPPSYNFNAFVAASP
jgi:glucan endo-1,3-alpha-glucosidase